MEEALDMTTQEKKAVNRNAALETAKLARKNLGGIEQEAFQC